MMPEKYPRRGSECGPCGTFTLTCLAFVCDECGHNFTVPRCLTEEVRWLHSRGVHVRSAHCLRWGDTGSIKVAEEHIPFMELFDYKHIDTNPFGSIGDSDCCFIPKTVMPADKEPERYEDWIKNDE